MTTKTVKLSPTVVNLTRKKASKQANRPGYVDPDGRVYLPPKSNKRVGFWQKKMTDMGYQF